MMLAGGLAGGGAIAGAALGLAGGIVSTIAAFGAASDYEYAGEQAARHIESSSVSSSRMMQESADGAASQYRTIGNQAAALKESAAARGSAQIRLAGGMRAAEIRAEAAGEQLDASREFTAGQETAAALKRELAAVIGGQTAAFARAGVMIGSPSARAAADRATAASEREVSIATSDALSRQIQRQRRAANLGVSARNAELEADVKAKGIEADASQEAALIRTDAESRASTTEREARSIIEHTSKEATAKAELTRFEAVSKARSTRIGAIGNLLQSIVPLFK